MKRLSYLVISLLAILAVSCTEEKNIYISLGLEDGYVVDRMQSLTLMPGYEGDSYEWRLSYEIGDEVVVDSLVATTRDYTFVGHAEGSYRLMLHLSGGLLPVRHYMTIAVHTEQVAYSPYITQVYEYRPAPGQFINEMPEYIKGDTEETMRQKVEDCLAYNARGTVSLGGYGGYVVVGFDHTITNRPGVCDFQILGNATYANSGIEGLVGGACEPGIVMVSCDTNGNGEPDDVWYELAGSEYHKSETIKGYRITYTRPDEGKEPTASDKPNVTDATYIRWDDNESTTGYVAKNAFHKQSYYPLWLTDETLTFHGTRLPDNGIDKNGDGSSYFLTAYDYGYADNHPNASEQSHFDIAWAVNHKGESVQLSGIDFVKIYTGVNQYNGWIGECSTEVMGVTDLHLEQNQ